MTIELPGNLVWLARRPVGLLLVLQTGLLGWAATRHSPGIDEVGHLAAGLHHWTTGTFDLYRVNPPLVRLVATAPLAVAGVGLPETAVDARPGARPEFNLGWRTADRHGRAVFDYFTWARWACLPFAWVGTYVVYRWGRELYGGPAGAFGAALWVICPNVLSNGQMITPDTGAAGLGAAAGYLFWRWLRDPGWGWVPLVGLALGLAELCKTTWLVLVPLWPAVWVAYRLSPGTRGGVWAREALQLAAVALLALYLINAGYAFEDVGHRLGDVRFISRAMTVEDDTGRRVNQFHGTAAGRLPLPVPRNYAQGVDVQKGDFEAGLWSYLRGEWRTEGWWYYYLYGLLVKTPLGTLFLAALALATGPFLRIPGAGWRDELVLLAPALAVLALVSSQTGMSHHLRYVLPAMPFLFVWVGRVAAYRGRLRRPWQVVLLLAAAASAASSLRVYPHAMSYFNEPAGGPLAGSDHLIGSNVDWGQDLLYLKAWYDARPDARPFHLAYFGYVDPRAAGIAFAAPPLGPVGAVTPPGADLGPRPGWYAVSVTILRGCRYPVPDGRGGVVYLRDPSFAYFTRFRPVATAGYSIWIYHLTPDECDRVRAELGLPPLDPDLK